MYIVSNYYLLCQYVTGAEGALPEVEPKKQSAANPLDQVGKFPENLRCFSRAQIGWTLSSGQFHSTFFLSSCGCLESWVCCPPPHWPERETRSALQIQTSPGTEAITRASFKKFFFR